MVYVYITTLFAIRIWKHEIQIKTFCKKKTNIAHAIIPPENSQQDFKIQFTQELIKLIDNAIEKKHTHTRTQDFANEFRTKIHTRIPNRIWKQKTTTRFRKQIKSHGNFAK